MRTERFIRAYDALVKAFFEGELEKGHCARCAVGNIVKASGVPSFWDSEYKGTDCLNDASDWKKVFYTNPNIGAQIRRFESYPNTCRELEELTGYSAQELAQIEFAFEENTLGNDINDQFKGLCAVVDVLLKLDNISPEDHYKNKFREHPQLV